MGAGAPYVVLLGGPNGAGKSTASRAVLPRALRVTTFVNADVIAAGFAGFAPQAAAVAAGRVMLGQLKQLAGERATFGFESTLASRTFAPWLAERRTDGYRLILVYMWLRSPEIAVARVQGRAARGGHGVDEATIRRRYTRSAQNLFRLYLPLADVWRVYDNSGERPALVASGRATTPPRVADGATWAELRRAADAAP